MKLATAAANLLKNRSDSILEQVIKAAESGENDATEIAFLASVLATSGEMYELYPGKTIADIASTG